MNEYKGQTNIRVYFSDVKMQLVETDIHMLVYAQVVQF